MTITRAQRPTYAGSSPIGVPGLASRFQDTTTATTITTSPGIVNRNDDAFSTTTTLRIPVDARGDSGLVNRINQWPRENQPFWYLNADHIEKQRNPLSQVSNKTTHALMKLYYRPPFSRIIEILFYKDRLC